MRRVTVIDYGVGNLLSVCRAFEHCGGEVELTDSPAAIAHADRLVLPGVGAFGDGMEGLRSRGLIGTIQEYAKKNRPFLGICLGMQMMLDSSEEFGFHEGLGLIPGKVLPIPRNDIHGDPHKVPSVGWKEIFRCGSDEAWNNTILNGIAEGNATYFVHSFAAEPASEHRLAHYRYGGLEISAVVASGMLYGCQFHPEKSGAVGLRIIQNFLNL